MYNINKINFKPIPFFYSGRLQTIFGSFGLCLKAPLSESMFIDLPDGDQLICKVSRPKTPKGIVILVHGLGGSEDSKYMIRMSRKLHSLNYMTIRVNLRGCGPGEGLARLPHSAACSEDLNFIIKKSHLIDTKLPIQIVGFSLGGHLLLKFLGVHGDNIPPYITNAIAVCPAVDPADTVRLFALKENRLFENYYIKHLIKLALHFEKTFPELNKVNFPPNPSMYQYDKLFTAPMWGFKSPDEYYENSKSSKVIHNIKIPCKILYSKDDPIVNYKTIESVEAPENVTLYSSKYGGHMGFLGYSGNALTVRFMDKLLIEWLTKNRSPGRLRSRRDLG